MWATTGEPEQKDTEHLKRLAQPTLVGLGERRRRRKSRFSRPVIVGAVLLVAGLVTGGVLFGGNMSPSMRLRLTGRKHVSEQSTQLQLGE
jgi:Tfp pilus assembly protein PilN